MNGSDRLHALVPPFFITSCGHGINPIKDLSFLLSWTTSCTNGFVEATMM